MSRLRAPNYLTEPAPANGGGFIPVSGLLSPPPSSIASSSIAGATLPTPRHHPLKGGSPKEATYINYVEKGFSDSQRKFALRDSGIVARPVNDGEIMEDLGEARIRNFAAKQDGGKAGSGYTSFNEAARDLEKLVDVIWVSGTPSLQVPHLLTVALLTLTYIPGFAPTPRSTFHLLNKLDSAFASLITGRDVQTGEPLPGLEDVGRRGGVSGTQKVRIKSLVERTRVVVVEVMSGDMPYESESVEGDKQNTRSNVSAAEETDDEAMDVADYLGEDADWDMEVARVYVKTLNELGDELAAPAIGIA